MSDILHDDQQRFLSVSVDFHYIFMLQRFHDLRFTLKVSKLFSRFDRSEKFYGDLPFILGLVERFHAAAKNASVISLKENARHSCGFHATIETYPSDLPLKN